MSNDHSSAAPAPSSAELLARAKALVPSIRSRALKADADRRVADETIKELLDAQILQMLAPRRFGGPQADLVTFLDVGIVLGTACGSTSWLFGILGCHHWVLSHFPIEAQAELYGSKNYALWPLSFSGKGGTARPVDSGFLVTGRWSFCSGIDFSDWIGGGVLLEKENPHDLHDRFNVLIPRTEGEVIDTWFTSGMRGTGSRDFVCKDVFVPKHRILGQEAIQSGNTPGYEVLRNEYPLITAPFYGVLLGAVLCPILGITRRVIDDFVEATRTRVGFRGRVPAERPAIQMKIGSAMTRYDATYRMIRALFEEIDTVSRAGEQCTVEQRLRQRRDTAYAAQECVEIVDDLVSCSGAGAQSQSSYFQLAQRDIHTIRTHVVLDVEEAMELYGKHALGQSLNSVRY
jgi:3-hydroxy-9,10-secoandrosta-1,3,5(10)-triene-9,17-dione monooxygenase